MIASVTSAKNEDTYDEGVIQKKVTSRDVEVWEVAHLNSEIASCSKPSDIFDKLKEKRKIRHEQLIRELSEGLHEINLRAEKNIKLSSLDVKTHMKYFDDQLQEILQNIDKPEVSSYCASVFLKYQNKAYDFKMERQKLVNELYDDLNKFDNDRAEENKKLLRVACEKIKKNGHLLPYEVQVFAEYEIMKMNELSLNNRRCYEDLKLQLTLLTEERFKSFVNKVFCIQEKWVRNKIYEAYFKMQGKVETKVEKLIPKAYIRLELKGQELMVHLSPDNLYSACKAEEWSKNVGEVIGAIETYGKNIIELYRKTLDSLYRNFDDEVEEIRKEISSLEALNIYERVIRPLLFDVQTEQSGEIESLESVWQTTLTDIKGQLKEVMEFIVDVGKLWDRHNERVRESKILILKALEKSDEKNERDLQELETKLNIALDILRQESDQTKLIKSLKAITTILNSIKAKYESIYLSDVKLIEDFYKFMNLESDVLSADIKEFIYEVHFEDSSKNLGEYSESNKRLPVEKLIFMNIKKCAQQIKAVKFWKYGVWTALETFSRKTKEFLEPRAEIWVEKNIKNLAEKLSVQIQLTEKRNERIIANIYEKRKAEIEFHQFIFDQLKEAVLSNFINMNEGLENLKTKKFTELEVIGRALFEIENSAKMENRPGIIHCNQVLVNRKKEELKEGLRFDCMKFRVDCESKMFDLRQTNINFGKDIKLFHEGGNYSAEEGKIFAALVEEQDRFINAELKNLHKSIAKDESDMTMIYSNLIDPILLLLTQLHEETLFNYEVETKLSYFANELCSLAHSLKNDFNLLKEQTNCFCSMIKNIERPLKDDDYKFLLQLLNHLYKNISNLFYSVNFVEAPNLKEEKHHLQNSDKVTISEFSRKIDLVGTFNCQDFKRKLFNIDNLPENNGTFMANISHKIFEEMDVLQKMACNFYNKIRERRIIRVDLIAPNYETLAEKILLKLQFFYIQCEQLWLQTVLDFLPVLSCIKVETNHYLERKLNEFQTSTLEVLKKYDNSFQTCLESLISVTSKTLKELDCKLLPLHGFHENKGLLKALEEEVVRRTAVLTTQWDSAIKKAKNQLKCFRASHIHKESEINVIQKEYLKMKDILFVDNIGINLVNLIHQYAERGGFYAQSTLPQFNNGEVPKEFKLKFDSFAEKLQSVDTYFKHLLELLKRENISTSSDDLRPEGSTQFVANPCCRKNLKILLEPLDFDRITMEILQKLNESLTKIQKLVGFNKNKQEENLFKWLETWKFNVKKVQKLYRVKYEEKLEDPTKTTTPQNG